MLGADGHTLPTPFILPALSSGFKTAADADLSRHDTMPLKESDLLFWSLMPAAKIILFRRHCIYATGHELHSRLGLLLAGVSCHTGPHY